MQVTQLPGITDEFQNSLYPSALYWFPHRHWAYKKIPVHSLTRSFSFPQKLGYKSVSCPRTWFLTIWESLLPSTWGLASTVTLCWASEVLPSYPVPWHPHLTLSLPPHFHQLHLEYSNTFQECFVGEILRWNTRDSWMQRAVVTSLISSLPSHSHSFACLGQWHRALPPRVSVSGVPTSPRAPPSFLIGAWNPLMNLTEQQT